MKNILAIDTSSPVLSIALKKGKDPVLETKIAGFLQHAENLLPRMDRLLKKKKLTIDDIDIFLIGRGPGSFTGLRIGFATLKGFLVLKKKTCFGALSLDMIAHHIRLPEGSRLGICLDARREKIYARFYRRQNDVWVSQGRADVLGIHEIINKFSPGMYLAGDALIRYGENLQKLSPQKKLHFLPESVWHPKASTLVEWYGRKSRNLQKLEKPCDFLPLYFRRSEAEEKSKYHDGHR